MENHYHARTDREARTDIKRTNDVSSALPPFRTVYFAEHFWRIRK